MSEGDAILQDIIANPTDDGLRLIYADWLDDNGDPLDQTRAEFIRIQIQLHRGYSVDPTTRQYLEKRQEELLPVISSYTPYIVPAPKIVVDDLSFSRGFVSSVSCTMDVWLQHGKTILSLHPLKYVRLSDRDTDTDGAGRHGYCNIDIFKNSLPQIPWPDRPFHIESTIWHLLNGHVKHASNSAWKFWNTKKEAEDALSRACLALHVLPVTPPIPYDQSQYAPLTTNDMMSP